VQESAAASAEAERQARAATIEPGSLVEQSKAVRAEVRATIDEKRMEFDDKLSQVSSA